ncbi:MAG TPA: hypothetical protein VFY14_01955, partial [Streptomyces sp.]|nr:hypothetical protein [Streptomyces sp.]
PRRPKARAGPTARGFRLPCDRSPASGGEPRAPGHRGACPPGEPRLRRHQPSAARGTIAW